MNKKRKLYISIMISGGLAVGIFLSFKLCEYFRDCPIEGGVQAFRAADREAKKHVYCACNGEGFLIVRDDYILWYVKDHDDLSVRGKIESNKNGMIEFKHIHPATLLPEEGDESTMELTRHGANMNESGYQYRLKKTYLGPDVAVRVKLFDYDTWRSTSQKK